jgi:glutaredoxin 3
VAKLELFGAATCQFTGELREWLEWNGREFIEYDVELDPNAMARMRALTRGQRMVPVLVEDGRVIQIGWQGRGCIVDAAGGAP